MSAYSAVAPQFITRAFSEWNGMDEPVEVKLQSYPTNLLTKKDWSKRKCYYRPRFQEFLQNVHDLEVYDDDVWLVTLPKCGTTWMQELLWLVMNDFDFETASNEDLEVRTPFMEFDFAVYGDLERAFKPIENLKRPRLIKTHLCLPLLPAQIWHKKPKLIYVARNIKDALVSEFYHVRYLGRIDTHLTLDQYITDQMEKRRAHEPFENLSEFYALRSEPWLFYTSFECMKLDLHQVILDVCKFLNKTIDESTAKRMLRHLSFEEMKKNPKTNHVWEFEQVRKKLGLPYEENNAITLIKFQNLHFTGHTTVEEVSLSMSSNTFPDSFCRRGQINVYKEELSPDIVKKLDKWVDENLLRYNLTMNDLLLLNEK